ncbi:hypothetical protein GYMLUDRAFT_1022098 [Collybiopsis luxurians FD-317 M1]|uniref:Oxidoreductase AflY n=1 Tax=Collybiopsis luxurians FD-317 M1 TaxID=944289 RepID=A0A0D0BY56_9AGAR|nr:hypothetical protein GYMLUDRAFT_1022098 [Collybiopsis luxurians FD-317 M1]
MSQIDLYPAPNTAPHVLSPTRWPGTTPESARTLGILLKENHEKWHNFYNNLKFHNEWVALPLSHVSHRLLALWALGADNEVLKNAYKFDSEEGKLRAAFSSPEPITAHNFYNHLEDESFFNAYVEFFTDIIMIQKKDVGVVLEQFVFSDQAHPGFRTRFFGGLLHGFIHLGYGTEFGMPGMMVEGLALVAVHSDTPGFDTLIQPSASRDTAVGRLVSGFKDALNISSGPDNQNTHALTILSRVMNDPNMECKELDPSELFSFFKDVEKAKALRQYVNDWSINASDPKELDRKIEELQWMNVLIFAAVGSEKLRAGRFRADFFLMHLVTSSLFLPSLAAHLSPSSQEAMFRGYLAVSLAAYVARGRPKIDPVPLFEIPLEDAIFDVNAHEDPPSLNLSASESLTAGGKTANPWLTLIPHAILHFDDHLPKFQRAVAHYASLYGYKSKGCLGGLGIELNGVECIDGTLFLRAGVLAYKRIGRDRGGRVLPSYWDFKGFYGDEEEEDEAELSLAANKAGRVQ